MKRYLFISDMHVGSLIAVCPPEVRIEYEGGEKIYRYNAIQKKLYEFWMEMCKEKYDGLFFLGDAVDGPNRGECGQGLWTTEPFAQARAAGSLLAKIKAPKRVFVLGTQYHVGEAQWSENVAASFGGFPPENVGKEFIVELGEGKRPLTLHIQHEITISKSTWQYRATPLAREMVLAELNSAQLGEIDGIVRGHTHYYVEVRYGRQFGFTLPGWKMRDRYSIRCGLSTVPRIGYVVLQVGNGGNEIEIVPHCLEIRPEKMEMIPRRKI